jgi:putative endonuclease
MEEGRTLVFIEVRFRASDRFGSAQESVNRQKQGRLLKTAACFLQTRRMDRPVRFDVAALSLSAKEISMDWIKGAFDAG